MADRKTVMSWLEGLTQDVWQSFHSDSEVQQIAIAAFELLKEQEPVEPILDSFLHKRCPSCKTLLKGKYCHGCGQAVKFDD